MPKLIIWCIGSHPGVIQFGQIQTSDEWYNHHMGLTQCGLVIPYADKDLGQHWLRQWLGAWHQAIPWTRVDFSSVRYNVIYLKPISQEMPQPSITKISFKIAYEKYIQICQGPANELINFIQCQHFSTDNPATNDFSFHSPFHTCPNISHISPTFRLVLVPYLCVGDPVTIRALVWTSQEVLDRVPDTHAPHALTRLSLCMLSANLGCLMWWLKAWGC